MTATSPLPGIVPVSSPDLVHQSPARLRFLARWLARSVALEIDDTPGRIAIATSAVAGALALGDLLFGAGVFGIFPYQYARLVIYGASFLSGGIIAAGFLSEARTARFAAILSTATIMAFALASQLQGPGWVFYPLKIVYGVGLVGAVAVALLRAVRRRLGNGGDSA